MDEDRKKAKKFVLGLFLLCLCIAFVCFGIFVYLVLMNRGAEFINPRIVTVSKIFVLIGIFFLVLTFGYLLPGLKN